MEQHPVPQHIASYEFRLVGDMTLKQFGYLASGGVVALIFYATPLPWYFKWPAVIFFAFLGFALAFLPIQERPLNQWIVAFVKAVFAPTQYLWERKAKKPEVLQYTPKQKFIKQTPAAPPDKAQMAAYLGTLPSTQAGSPIHQQEENRLQQINQLLQSPTQKVVFYPSQPPQPRPAAQQPTGFGTIQQPKSEPALPPLTFQPRTQVQSQVRPESVKPFVRRTPQATSAESIMIKGKGPVVLPEKPGQPKRQAVQAKTSSQLPIPTPPTEPNLLVGMVLDRNNEMIEGTIIEIRDSKGMPVRALKTNKLGQFRIATPLPTGTYEIETEKEGYHFDIIKITLKGEAVSPLEIRAK